jgi:polysaccharide export outer membrane protein
MASGYPGDAVRQINRLFQHGTVGALTDGQLLERFSTRRGEAAESAFEALVTRHGPMVLRVARGLLRDPHDVDDAFQATFLVLVKKAGSIGERELLGPWLYGVAHRVALKARSIAARRSKREGGIADDPPASEADAAWLDLRPVLHEELDRLPEKYRKPVVLCHLQGLTHAEAAQELAWPVGTVSVRLARARKLLRDRLTRRGLTVTGALWGAGLAAEGAQAALPQALIQSTIVAAMSYAASRSLAAGVVSAGAGALTRSTLTMMFVGRLKWIAVLLTLVVGAAGGALATRAILSKPTTEELAGPPLELDTVPSGFFDITALATKDESGPAPVQRGQTLLVEALEALPGRPVTGERIVRSDGTIGLGFYGNLQVAGLNRDQIKVKVIEHLRKYINDEVLGLVREDVRTGKITTVSPVDSNRVFVDDSVDLPRARDGGPKPEKPAADAEVRELKTQVAEIGGKLDRALKELEELRRERPPAGPRDAGKVQPF